jgi:hypothetical protein
LKSKLMVAALQCGYHIEYNAFVQRHQTDLIQARQQLTLHFTRLYGARQGESERDSFITDLANSFAQEGMRPTFCAETQLFVQRSGSVRNMNDMSQFVTAYGINDAVRPPCRSYVSR